MARSLAEHGIVDCAQLYGGDVFQTQQVAVGQGAHHHLLVVFGVFVAAAVLQHILECIGRFGAECARGSLYVLLGENLVDIRRHQPVLRHPGRVEPYAHGVLGTEDVDLAYTRDSRYLRLNVDFHVVGKKLGIVGIVGAVECYRLESAVLAFAHCDTAFGDFGRQQTLGRGHTVLYVDHSHVGIGALFEVYGYRRCAGVGGGRCHVHHVLDAVQRLLERHYHAFHHSLGICTRVGGRYPHGGRSYVRKLFDGQIEQTQYAQCHNQHGDDSGQYRTVDKSLYSHVQQNDFKGKNSLLNFKREW